MVRREEQPWQSRASLLLDTRSRAHAGQDPDSSLEYAVSAAASIGVHLADRGYAVRLVTDEGGAVSGSWHDSGGGPAGAEVPLLDALAVVRSSRDASVGRWSDLLKGAGAASGLLVAVLGACIRKRRRWWASCDMARPGRWRSCSTRHRGRRLRPMSRPPRSSAWPRPRRFCGEPVGVSSPRRETTGCRPSGNGSGSLGRLTANCRRQSTSQVSLAVWRDRPDPVGCRRGPRVGSGGALARTSDPGARLGRARRPSRSPSSPGSGSACAGSVFRCRW